MLKIKEKCLSNLLAIAGDVNTGGALTINHPLGRSLSLGIEYPRVDFLPLRAGDIKLHQRSWSRQAASMGGQNPSWIARHDMISPSPNASRGSKPERAFRRNNQSSTALGIMMRVKLP
jgi:hypothetical protein